MNFERCKCNKMQIKSKHLCKIHLNNSIPTDRKILFRSINTAALGCFHTSFACRRKILHYFFLSRVFFINFSYSSTVSPEHGKSPSPPHDPLAHSFFLYQYVMWTLIGIASKLPQNSRENKIFNMIQMWFLFRLNKIISR